MYQEPENFEPSNANCSILQHTLFDVRALNNILNSDPNSEEFTTFVYSVASDIKILRNTRTTINLMSKSGNYEGFLKELMCFLQDIGCTNEELITDTISIYLQSKRGRLWLIENLISNLLIAKIERPCSINNNVAQLGMDMAFDMSPILIDLNKVLLAFKVKEFPPKVPPELFYFIIKHELEFLEHKKLLHMNSLKNLINKSQYNSKAFKCIYAEYQSLRQILVYRLYKMTLVSQEGPPHPDSDIMVHEISPFEKSVLSYQRYEITQCLANIATLIELKTNFLMNEEKQNVVATVAHMTNTEISNKRKFQPEAFIKPRVEHEAHGEGIKHESVYQNKSRYDMDAPGCSGIQKSHTQNRKIDIIDSDSDEGGAGLDERLSNLNIGMANDTRPKMNRGNGGLTAGHQSTEPFINVPSTSQGNYSAPEINPASYSSIGRARRRRGRSTRRSRGPRHVNYDAREDYCSSYEERRSVEISAPNRGNRVFRGGVGRRGSRGRGIPHNALHQNRLGFENSEPPLFYIHNSQILLFEWNNTFVLAAYHFLFLYR